MASTFESIATAAGTRQLANELADLTGERISRLIPRLIREEIARVKARKERAA